MKRRVDIFLFVLFFSPALNAQDTLSLQQALEIALQNNYGVQIARNDAAIAANNNSAGNAGYLPSLSLSTTQSNNVNNTRQEFFTGEVRQRDGAKSNALNAQAELNWTIFDGFSMFANADYLEALEKIGEVQARDALERTAASVIVTYYDIVRRQRQLEVIREAIAISAQRKKLAEDRLGLGAGSRLEVLQAQVDGNADSSALLSEILAMTESKAALNILMARPAETEFLVSRTISVQPDLNYTAILEKAKNENPAVQLARQNAYLAALDVRRTRSTYYPFLDLNAGYGYSRSQAEVGILKSNRSAGLTYGFTAGITIFDGFNARRQVRNAKLAQESRNLDVKFSEQETAGAVYTAWQSYSQSLRRAALDRQNLDAAKTSSDVALERYRLGTSSAIELRDAQQNYVEAQQRLLEALFEAKMAEVELLRLSGQLVK